MSHPDSPETFSSLSQDEKNSLVQARFGAVAQAYTTSKVHAEGPDLAWIVDLAALTGKERVVDIGTGTGHTALALAPGAAEVVAVDMTRPMLDEARRLAASRGIANVRFLQADTASLPLPDGQFDLVACRKAAHHFTNVPQTLHEWARILKMGAKVILVDSVSPEEAAIDSFLHEIEFLRDPSHVHNWRISEWLALLAEAGFNAHLERTWSISLDISSWTQRMKTPFASVAEIERMLAEAPSTIRERLQIGPNEQGQLSFELPTAMFVGTRRA